MKTRTRIARSWRRRSLAFAAALALSGCSSVVTTTTSYDVYFRSGVLSEFGYAASRTGGVMPVAVVGNPFDLPKAGGRSGGGGGDAGQERRRAGALRPLAGRCRAQRLRGDHGVRRRSRSCRALCVERDAFPAPPASSGTLLAVFCGGTDARSWAFSSIGPVASPDDPLFRKMVGQTTFLMIPNRDDDYTSRSVFR